MDLNATILGQMISFIIFIWFCMKYIWPKLITTINNRKIFIQNELYNIKNSKKDIKIMHLQAKKIIYSSRKKAVNIIKLANEDKIAILEKAKFSANQNKIKILEQANLEIKMQKIKLRQKLEKEVSILASIMANKIIVDVIQKYQKPNIENFIKTI